MNDICSHGGSTPREVLDRLPSSQAGVGRHKCAICAYEQGVKHGIEQTASRLEGLLTNLISKLEKQLS